jgi:hypothetical protein
MKSAVILAALFVASSVLHADDADEDTAPVTTITPTATAPVAVVAPVQTVWTLKPIAVDLIAVLASTAPSPSKIQALVAQLTTGEIANVVLSVFGNPSALSALVAQLTTDQLASVTVEVMKNPTAFSAFVAQLSTTQIADTVGALQHSPTAISALVATMSLPQSAKVLAALAGDSAALAVVMSQMDASKLTQVKIELFLTDIDGWQSVDSFLNPPESAKKPFSRNWLDAERAKLQAKILRDGYTPEHLSEAVALMKKAQ